MKSESQVVEGKYYCPKCTNTYWTGSPACVVSDNPVWLVKRINKQTGDWFMGCPNFPKCKHSRNRPLTLKELNDRTISWANAQCGPHY